MKARAAIAARRATAANDNHGQIGRSMVAGMESCPSFRRVRRHGSTAPNMTIGEEAHYDRRKNLLNAQTTDAAQVKNNPKQNATPEKYPTFRGSVTNNERIDDIIK